jgi:hypothetical protein
VSDEIEDRFLAWLDAMPDDRGIRLTTMADLEDSGSSYTAFTFPVERIYAMYFAWLNGKHGVAM